MATVKQITFKILAVAVIILIVNYGCKKEIFKDSESENEKANYESLKLYGCGGIERWDVKTLTDSKASLVSMVPVSNTVHNMRLLTVPGPIGTHTPRYNPAECKTYIINALITFYKFEADSDIHAVIADPTNRNLTMIVEFPSTNCTVIQSSHYLTSIKTARKDFLNMVKAAHLHPNQHASSGISVHVTGTAFFDKLHGQTGVAPNGVELHPVLKIQ